MFSCNIEKEYLLFFTQRFLFLIIFTIILILPLLPGLDEANLKVSWPEKRTEEGWRSSNKNYLVSSDLTYIN